MYLLKANENDQAVKMPLSAAQKHDGVVHSFDAEAIVATQASENTTVLHLAHKHHLGFGLYHPNVADVADVLKMVLDGQMRSCGKILYLRPDQEASWQKSGLLELFVAQGALVASDYETHCLDLIRYNMCWGDSFE